MRLVLGLVSALLLSVPANADDWTGKTVRAKEDGLKLGRKLGGGLVRDGAVLDKGKTYTVKSDDGTLLELDGGFVFRSDVEVAADARPFPKPLKDGEMVKTDGWFGKSVLPKRPSNEIRMGDWKDGKQETWTPHNLNDAVVREDRDGFLRLYDGRREGWVSKADMVTAEDAPIFFDKAVKERPNDGYGWYMRALGWLKKGECDNAIKDFTEAIRLKPDDFAPYTSRGNAWLGKKEYDKAISDFTEAIRLKPDSDAPFSARGIAWNNKKEYDKAIADYNEAIRIDPNSAFAFGHRGDIRYDQKEYEKAIADYDEAIRLDPKYESALNHRGVIRCYQKEYDKAIDDFTELISLNPKDATRFNNRGLAWKLKKEYHKAIADYDAALKLDSMYAFAHGNRAGVYAKLKKYDDAIAGFEKSSELKPRASIHRDFAKFRASCPDAKYRDGKKAVELAKKAIEKAGKDADWQYADALAMAYAEAGDFELAVSEQRKAIDMLKGEKFAHKDDIKAAEARLELYRAKKPYRDEE